MTNFSRAQVREAVRKSATSERQLDEIEAAIWALVRPEERVPPLPTESGYYVDPDGCAWRLDDGEWDDTFGNPMDGVELKTPLVRYEPRAITAKAVFDRVRDYNGLDVGESDEFDSIAIEFGIES